MGKVLASFQETLVSGGTSFDKFRDGLAKGTDPDKLLYSEPAKRGLRIFIGKGACTTCHSGPNFTAGEFFNTGLSRFQPQGKPDPGREGGIRQLKESRFNLLSDYNDDATGASREHLRKVVQEKTPTGEFKVPSLRNLLMTAPYGRDGRIDKLSDVIKHYAELDPVRLRARDGQPGTPLKLTAGEQTDLLVFLESLSTFTNAWRPEEGGRCE